MDNGWRRNKYGGLFNINDIDNKMTTNEYMNNKIRNRNKKITKEEYILKKEQMQEPLKQEFGLKPKEEKFRYKAERLLSQLKKK